MKKIITIFILLILTTACSNNYLKKINLDKLNNKLNNKETFILYLTNEDEAGVTLKNTLLNVAKEEDIQIFYLNTSKLNDEELKNLNEKFTFEESNFIIFIKDGQENTLLSRIDDTFISQDNLKDELKNQGYLN